ncbi:MAG: CDP-alcohol phosphatidyltransferase family protein [Thermoleophilia bacterium]
MTDAILRRHKEVVLTPVARLTPLPPAAITLAGLVPGVGAALAAAAGRPWLAVTLWLVNRLLDGLDGTVARVTGRQTDLGAYLDIVADFVVYAAVPIGIAAHAGDRGAWVAAAVLLGTFYVNAISWSFLSALMERRRIERGLTSVAMPAGLIEGAETVVLFAVMLTLPAWARVLMWGMAGAVVLTTVQRVTWALRTL